MPDIKRISVGVDPEFFTVDKKMGRFCSAHDLVPGDKEKPHKLKNGAVQADGCAIEFNTEPAYTPKEFSKYTAEVIEQIRKMVPENYDFEFKPVVYFDRYYFDKMVPIGPKELGCNPDFNAWTGVMNPRPVPVGAQECMRTASGHFHIGFTEGADVTNKSHQYDCKLIVRALDQCVLPWIKLFDKDKDREKLYGAPGAMRFKSYGVEWRTPSNAWLNHPELWEWLHEAITFTVNSLSNGKFKPAEYNWQYHPSGKKDYWGNNEYIPWNIRSNVASYDEVAKWVEEINPGFPKMPRLKGMEEVKEDLVLPAVPAGAYLAYAGNVINVGQADNLWVDVEF
jgi:hypothetical protein